jgi:hypothetical protein
MGRAYDDLEELVILTIKGRQQPLGQWASSPKRRRKPLVRRVVHLLRERAEDAFFVRKKQKLLGVSQLPFEHQPGQHLPEAVLDQVQSRLSQVLCSPRDVAQAVLFAITQPISVNIAELVVRPPRGLAALAS